MVRTRDYTNKYCNKILTIQDHRDRVVNEYYADPNHCQHCRQVILLRENERRCDVRKKKFCNKSCAAKYNNKRVKKRKSNPRFCSECGENKVNKHCKSGKCRKCLSLVFINKSKGELFSSRKNWQSARSNIQRHARRVYIESVAIPICEVCGYTHHVEVAHKKPVSDFDDDALIVEINDIKNLCGLCPNHHWEFDAGILKFI